MTSAFLLSATVTPLAQICDMKDHPAIQAFQRYIDLIMERRHWPSPSRVASECGLPASTINRYYYPNDKLKSLPSLKTISLIADKTGIAPPEGLNQFLINSPFNKHVSTTEGGLVVEDPRVTEALKLLLSVSWDFIEPVMATARRLDRQRAVGHPTE